MASVKVWQNGAVIRIIEQILGMVNLEPVDFLHTLNLSVQHFIVHAIILEGTHERYINLIKLLLGSLGKLYKFI